MRVLYLNNYMSTDIAEKRKSKNIYSQPANNKVSGILSSLLKNNCNVVVLSSGLTNHKSGKLYREERGTCMGVEVIYCAIRDLPLINILSSIHCMYKEIKKECSQQKVDNIIFYNYKPEVAWAAYLAKKKLHIPITVEYEDGYATVSGLGKLKSAIFRKTENIVSKKVDYAILVNSSLNVKYKVPAVVVRGVVDEDFYNTCKKYHKSKNDKFTILYSGGLDKSRGIDVLLKAMSLTDIDCKLIITGKGSLEIDDNRIEFKGFVSHEEMRKLMMQADVLVQCQLVKDEFASTSFPSKIFEYIATGNSIISSDLPEVVDFAGNAITYYHNDEPRDLATTICERYTSWKYEDNIESSMSSLCEENLPRAVGARIMDIWEKAQ